MTSARVAMALLLGVLWFAVPGGLFAGAPDPAPFVLRIVSPSPLHLAGTCQVTAVAELADGTPHDRIAWMTLSVDGRAAVADSEPPFTWQLELEPGFKPHELRLEAVDRDGARATLSALSARNPFVETVGVDLVLVPVVVREAGEAGHDGRLVGGLRAEDFTVLEDGVPQPLTLFTRERMPLSLVVALDTSASMERSLWSAQKAVTEFMRAQPPQAEVSLLAFNDQVYMEQDFTGARDTVVAAVMRLRAEGTRTALVDALRIGSRHLSRRVGTRVLVLFTDGRDTVYEGETGRLRTAIEAAQAADVSVFAVAFGAADLEPLDDMTAQTGGETVIARGTRELRAAFERLAESIGGRYLLGYELRDPDRAGYRRLEVKVARPNVRVLSRTGVGR
jgi:Ca-activated chloride channel homolog